MSNMHKFLFGVCMVMSLCGCREKKETHVTELVNPFVDLSTGEYHSPETFIPFGNLRIRPNVEDDCRLYAFSHVYYDVPDTLSHLSICLMPTVQCPATGIEARDFVISCQSTFSSSNEQATPGYYGVTLDNGIRSELSLTKHCGIYSYQFPAGERYGVVLDFASFFGEGNVSNVSLWKASSRILQGTCQTSTSEKECAVYFCLEFSRDVKVWLGERFQDELTNGQEKILSGTCVWVDFGNTIDKILVKIGLSSQAESEAFNYLQKEIPHWSFDKVKREALHDWRRLLSRIKIKSDDMPAMKEFYTALYHAYTVPLIYFDIKEVYKDTDWDLNDIYMELRKNADLEAELVFSALGLLPGQMGNFRYDLAPPRFPRVIIRLGQDRRFVIKSNRRNDRYASIESVYLNGKVLQRSWIMQNEIVRGGTLEVELTDDEKI